MKRLWNPQVTPTERMKINWTNMKTLVVVCGSGKETIANELSRQIHVPLLPVNMLSLPPTSSAIVVDISDVDMLRYLAGKFNKTYVVWLSRDSAVKQPEYLDDYSLLYTEYPTLVVDNNGPVDTTVQKVMEFIGGLL